MNILLTTYPNDWRKLKNLVTALLKKKLVACVNVLNYTKSYYLREGKIKKDEEKLLLIKFSKGKEPELLEFIKKQHPYKVPELIILPIEKVNEPYLNRLKEATK